MIIIALCVVITVTSIIRYRKSKRPDVQNVQMSRIASASTAYDPQNTLSQQASAPALVNKAAQPPPSYTAAQQQYPYPYPGQQYEMQPYPEYPQYPAAPGDPSTTPPYPGHGTYPQQYYPAVGDTSKYYPQQM